MHDGQRCGGKLIITGMCINLFARASTTMFTHPKLGLRRTFFTPLHAVDWRVAPSKYMAASQILDRKPVVKSVAHSTIADVMQRNTCSETEYEFSLQALSGGGNVQADRLEHAFEEVCTA